MPLLRCVVRLLSIGGSALVAAADAAERCLVAPRELLAGANCTRGGCDPAATAACIAFRGASSVSVGVGLDSVVLCDAASGSTIGCPLTSALPATAPPTCATHFQCFQWQNPVADQFTFLVAANTTPVAWSSGTDGLLWQNDSYVDAVAGLAFPDSIKNVTIAGAVAAPGSALTIDLLPKGRVANVRLHDATVSAQATSLTLLNLNLSSVSRSTLSFPNQSKLQALRIANCLLDSVPASIAALPALTDLDLSSNMMTRYPQEGSLETLIHLNVSGNALVSLDATFPRLQSLDLRDNSFKIIPDTVFLFSKLKVLYLSGNPLESSRISPTQFYFLSNLTTLDLDGFADPVVCDPAQEKLLKTYRVCVMDSTEVVVLKTRSFTTIIVFAVLAPEVLTVAAFVMWRAHRKKRERLEQEETQRALVTKGEVTAENDSAVDENKDRALAAQFVRARDSRSNDRETDQRTAGSSDDDDGSAGGFHFRRSTRAPPRGRSMQTATTGTNVSSGGSLWADDELLACQLRYEDIEDLRIIGSGAYGVVWLVNYRQSRLLASKRLVKDQLTRQKTQAFVAEIKLVAKLNHPSVVEFIGVAMTVETDLQALFEYMPNGDLRSFLEKTSAAAAAIDAVASWRASKLAIALDIVEGLVYVHSFNPPLVHRDLKSRNILLGEDMRAKLSDFGVSRFQSENGTMTAGVGTGKWLAPEVLSGDSDYDQSCDIYAFGVLLSELDTHALPYEELALAEVAVLQMVVAGHLRPRLSGSCPTEIRELALQCLAFDRHARPNAMAIAFRLRSWARHALSDDGMGDTDGGGGYEDGPVEEWSTS